MLKFLSAIFVLILTPSFASGATLFTNSNGQLTGAAGVDVEGAIYDVAFLKGKCSDVFSGCDDAADFTFHTPAAALAAANALLGQVFLDSVLGNFDSDPTLTFGCGAPECYIIIPTSVSVGGTVGGAAAINTTTVDPAAFIAASGDVGTQNDRFNVWASFSPARISDAVPEPATWAMMVVGFAAAGFAMRRTRRLAGLYS